MPQSPFADLRGLPYYDEPTLFLALGNRLWAWEFNGWKPESMSWKTGCYIHTGLSDTQVNFKGPDVQALFSSICVNSFADFPIGSMKHAIMCLENGLIASHGIAHRLQAAVHLLVAKAEDAGSGELTHPGRLVAGIRAGRVPVPDDRVVELVVVVVDRVVIVVGRGFRLSVQ